MINGRTEARGRWRYRLCSLKVRIHRRKFFRLGLRMQGDVPGVTDGEKKKSYGKYEQRHYNDHFTTVNSEPCTV